MKPLTPKGYMEKIKILSLYDSKLNYIGERVIYRYRGTYYIIKSNNKAYEIGLKTLNGKVFAMLKPNGLVKD